MDDASLFGASGPAGRLGQQLTERERKRAILEALRDSLSVWEQDVDWAGLSADRQQALLRLADESRATLRTLIARLEAELAGRTPEAR